MDEALSRPVETSREAGTDTSKDADANIVAAAAEEPGVVIFAPDRGVTTAPDVRILHFNDVYHLDPSSAEPVGGAARFQTAVDEYRTAARFANQPELVVLFSGDAYNPSLESSVTKGSHMVPILNNLGTACACVGNHDLDFGTGQFEYLAAKCNFPWLIANVFDPALGDNVPIGHAQRTCMITTSSGVRIGLLGLGEREWLDTVNSLPPNIVYKSAAETALELIPQLRRDGADMVVVLSHAREPNDNKLAKSLNGAADLILGGHDHYYAHSIIGGTHVLRSGTDFKQLSYLEAWRRPAAADRQDGRDGRTAWDFAIHRRDITSTIEPHAPTLHLVDELTTKLKQSLEKAVGWTVAPLDARFTTVRFQESNLGNFVCDIMRHHYRADCTIMAAGTIRGDQVYPPGPLRVKDITDCFPFEDPVVVIRVTGAAILGALENGVSLYPALEGRFPQVSNIWFVFDPSRPPGSRVTACEIAGAPAIPDKQYVLCNCGYMARGKDGYHSLLVKSEGGVAEEVVDEESGILISMLLRQYFMALKVINQWTHRSAPMERHWKRVVSSMERSHPHLPPKTPSASLEPHRDASLAGELLLSRSNSTPFDERVVDGASPVSDAEVLRQVDHQMQIMRRVAHKWCRLAGIKSQAGDPLTSDEYHADWTRAISPCVEGRIRLIQKTIT